MVFRDIPREDHELEDEDKEEFDVPNNDDIDQGEIFFYCFYEILNDKNF